MLPIDLAQGSGSTADNCWPWCCQSCPTLKERMMRVANIGIQPVSGEVCLRCHGTHPLQKTHSFLFCWQRMTVEDPALWPQELLGMGFVEHYSCLRWIKGSVWEEQDGMPESINSSPHSLPAIHSLLLGFIFQTKTSAKSTHGVQICIV